jgi:hypothetical protein
VEQDKFDATHKQPVIFNNTCIRNVIPAFQSAQWLVFTGAGRTPQQAPEFCCFALFTSL